jgi:hypothetical protein
MYAGLSTGKLELNWFDVIAFMQFGRVEIKIGRTIEA